MLTLQIKRAPTNPQNNLDDSSDLSTLPDEDAAVSPAANKELEMRLVKYNDPALQHLQRMKGEINVTL